MSEDSVVAQTVAVAVAMSANQYNLTYDVLSFSLATMMATTIFLWMRVPGAAERYKSALIISGLVTFIAAYHYMRIFNSWTEAFAWSDGAIVATGVPFNDAYRYMDWLLTVPLLLIEIILVMKLSAEETTSKAITLGSASALMIIIGYPGELFRDEDDLTPRYFYWAGAMIPFLYIVKELLVGLSDVTESEEDPKTRGLIKMTQIWTVISWCTYPIVYLFPMLGITGANATVGIQLGYSVSDIISKCGVGLLIYQVTMAKSAAIKSGNSDEARLLN